MSTFNTWDEIQDWMQSKVNDEGYDDICVKFPHPSVQGLYVLASLIEDAYSIGWYLELYQAHVVVIKHYVTDMDNYNLFEDVTEFIEGLKAFCPDPTTVKVIRDDGD